MKFASHKKPLFLLFCFTLVILSNSSPSYAIKKSALERGQTKSVLEKGRTIKAVSINPTPRVQVASTSQADIIAAIAEIKEAGGGTLYFPAGEYIIDRHAGARTHLYFDGINELKIIGDGQDRTKLIFAQNPAFKGKGAKTIFVKNANRLEIANLSLKGQRDYMNPETVPAIGEVHWARHQHHRLIKFNIRRHLSKA